MSSVNEIFESELKFESRHGRYYEIYPKFQNVLKSNRIIELNATNLRSNWIYEMIEENAVRSQYCEYFRKFIYFHGDGKSYDGIYQVSEPVFQRRNNLFVPNGHMLLDKFQVS